MKKYFRVGMTVWDIFGEAGTVVSISGDSAYPICVEFSEIKTYTYDGRSDKFDSIIIFQIEPIITPNVPIIEFEQGELVWCSCGVNAIWEVRFFSHIGDNQYHCFSLQRQTGLTLPYQQIRKFNDNPLLPPNK